MDWKEIFPQDRQPTLEEIGVCVGSPLWDEFCACMGALCGTPPRIEYSRCGGAPGWNVKYRRGGRGICTLYPLLPGPAAFTCLISVGTREAQGAELLLGALDLRIGELYARTRPFNGGRWLMIDVTDRGMMEGDGALAALRVPSKR